MLSPFSNNLTQQQEDFRLFCDGGSRVPYFVQGGYYKTNIILKDKEIDFENKIYISDKSRNYYVGIRLSNYFRVISANEFHYVENEIKKLKKISKNIQLLFDL